LEKRRTAQRAKGKEMSKKRDQRKRKREKGQTKENEHGREAHFSADGLHRKGASVVFPPKVSQKKAQERGFHLEGAKTKNGEGGENKGN